MGKRKRDRKQPIPARWQYDPKAAKRRLNRLTKKLAERKRASEDG